MTDNSRSGADVGDGSGDLLASALSTAFTPADVFRPSVVAAATLTEAPPPVTVVDNVAAAVESAVPSYWKAEYESHVQKWRAQSAHAREKAERERARWEDIRASEHAQAATAVAANTASVQLGPHSSAPSPQDAGSNGTAVSEAEGAPSSDNRPVSAIRLPFERRDTSITTKTATTDGGGLTQDGSQKWEEVPSIITSSPPSLSFPSRSPPTSPPAHSASGNHRNRATGTDPHSAPSHAQAHAHPHRNPHPPVPVPANTTALSATRAIFDSSLPARARTGALLSALAINLLLPFVNGVMLGFGEIFAKNVLLKWFGWRRPGGVVADVGINKAAFSRR